MAHQHPQVSDAFRGVGKLKQLDIPARLLLGPGPSNVPPRVNLALAAPMIGYADPQFFSVLDETCGLLRYLFQTNNEFTIPISGAGSSAMETCLANLIEPGDVVVVLVSGYFSERIYEMAGRYGADRRRLEKAWGTSCFSLDEIKAALEQHKPKLLALVHGETSTGIKQQMEGIGSLCHSHNALLMVDTVASLGSVPFFVDAWEIDACYTGGQKCISGPPGISPLTFSPLAMKRIKERKTPVANWYLDSNLLAEYWVPVQGAPRKYHHTPPTNLIYGLRESVLLVAEEGLENVWKRHQEATDALYAGLQELGLAPFVQDPQMRLPSLTTIAVPEGVDHAEVASYLLQHHNIEIARGLGPLLGKVWRVGLMGYNARVRNVKHLLSALKEAVAFSKEKKQKSGL
eukprot:TRINITY_DN3615_c0_g1_i1.p1 TRINITY_DN3615_c0_g1~~TRINITY_DN3615_c0_g1_i1.p1  ORF type:complete len:432 (+),score=159.86 TRINITY_DN3615_c0_g1_i1:93-1298(+)